jgi:LytS/YehU family sensor histidine kinase
MNILRTLAKITAVILAFVAIFFLFLVFRNYPLPFPPPPLTWTELTRMELHQLDIGFSLQWIIVPVILLYLLPAIPYFRRLLQDQTVPHATRTVLVALVAIQLISQGYEIWATYPVVKPFNIDYLVILFGSLLGGWRIGIPLGIVSMLFQGAYEAVGINHIQNIIQTVGLWEFIKGTPWPVFLYTNFFNPNTSAGFWVGGLSCLSARFLGPRRYSPLAAMVLGAGITFAAGYWQLAANVPPGILTAPAKAIITGLAAAMLMMMIRNLQVEASHRKAAAAELARTQAELRALRAQINPHFFFNALNTIRYMIREDPKKARDLLIDLSEVFQRTLRSGDFVPLRDELSCVEAYLSLEKARLGDRLRIVWGGLLQPDKPLETKAPLLDQPVPTLILQPLVENAVIHGVGKKIEGGVVSINIDRLKSDLVITVTDDGTGMDSDRLAELLQPGREYHASIGLSNVDSRLRLLYGPECGLAITSEIGKGTRVIIRIPISKKEAKPRTS